MLAKDYIQVYEPEDFRLDENGYSDNHATFYGGSGGVGVVVAADAQDYYAPIVDTVFYDDASVIVPTALTPDVVAVDTDSTLKQNPAILPPDVLLSTDGNVYNESGNAISSVVKPNTDAQTDKTETTAPIPSIGGGTVETPLTGTATGTTTETKTNNGSTGDASQTSTQNTADTTKKSSNGILLILALIVIGFIIYKLIKRG